MGHVPEEPEGVHGCGGGGGGAGGAAARVCGFRNNSSRCAGEWRTGGGQDASTGRNGKGEEVLASWAGGDRAYDVGTTRQ